MKKRRQFTPEFVDSLEERALLSGGFKFPAALGPVTTLGFRGNFVLTSRTYAEVQNTINTAFQAFRTNFVRAFQRTGGFGTQLDTILGTVPGGKVGTGPGQYTTGLLGRIDLTMFQQERRIPFGLNLNPPGFTGGVGLSTLTAPTSAANTTHLAVAEQLDAALNSGGTVATSATPNLNSALQAIEAVRETALNVVGNAPLALQVPGTLPAYIQLFGPRGLSGARDFGLRNT